MSDTYTITDEKSSTDLDEYNDGSIESKQKRSNINNEYKTKDAPSWKKLKRRYKSVAKKRLTDPIAAVHILSGIVMTLGLYSLSPLYLPLVPLFICLYVFTQSYIDNMSQFGSIHFGIITGILYSLILGAFNQSMLIPSVVGFVFFTFIITFLSFVYNDIGKNLG